MNRQQLPLQSELRQPRVVVSMQRQKSTGPLLQNRIKEAQKALHQFRILPVRFDGKATIAAVMIVAVTYRPPGKGPA